MTGEPDDVVVAEDPDPAALVVEEDEDPEVENPGPGSAATRS